MNGPTPEPRKNVRGDGHFCDARIMDYGNPRPNCLLRGEPMVRIKHYAEHTVEGERCKYPPTWRFCFRPAEILRRRNADPLHYPDWELAP